MKPQPPPSGRPRNRARGGRWSNPPGPQPDSEPGWGGGEGIGALGAPATLLPPSPSWGQGCGGSHRVSACLGATARFRGVRPRLPLGAHTWAPPRSAPCAPGLSGAAAGWTYTHGAENRPGSRLDLQGPAPSEPAQAAQREGSQPPPPASAQGLGLPRKCNNIYNQREMRKCSPSTRSTSLPRQLPIPPAHPPRGLHERV